MEQQTYYYCTYVGKRWQQVTFGASDKATAIQEYLELLTTKDENISDLKIWSFDGKKRIDCTLKLNKYLNKKFF